MATSPSKGPLNSLLFALIAFLLGVFYLLFQPETPTSATQSGAVIPLSTTSKVTSPSQIQGSSTSINPQQAAQVKSGQLDNINL